MASRFPWLVVDEYQDLGPVLHAIVIKLREAGTHVFCVGDPDQSVMGFQGADPRYLRELGQRDDVKTVELKRNYRSGSVILASIFRNGRTVIFSHFVDLYFVQGRSGRA